MHTEGVTYYNAILVSDFFDPQSSLLSVLQSQTCTKTLSERLWYMPARDL